MQQKQTHHIGFMSKWWVHWINTIFFDAGMFTLVSLAVLAFWFPFLYSYPPFQIPPSLCRNLIIYNFDVFLKNPSKDMKIAY
jgi:hypothetical protein